MNCANFPTGREQEYAQPYNGGQGYPQGPYSPPPPGGYLPPQQNAGYPAQQQYPGGTYFPPPPTGDNAYAYNDRGFQEPSAPQQQYATYNPADYAQGGAQHAQHSPYESTRGMYGESDANLGPSNEPYPTANNARGMPDEHENLTTPVPPQQHPSPAPEERRRGRDTTENNVSASNGFASDEREAARDGDAGTSDSGRTHTRSLVM